MEEVDFTKLFLQSTKDSKELQDALKLVESLNSGDSWLIGGFVYRSIAAMLYGAKRPAVDLDFIVETPPEEFFLPAEWIKSTNRFGNPKLIRDDGMEIDFVPLQNIHSIVQRRLPATIENFLSGTPLNIQSIAFDVENQKVIGNIGMKAMAERVVRINDREQAEVCAMKKGKPINEIIGEKALALGFTPIYTT